MNQSKKVVGRRDYWTVVIHYGEYQGKRRYVIEKDINAEDGDEEEDWDDVDEIGGKSLHWDRSDLYDEEDGDEDEN